MSWRKGKRRGEVSFYFLFNSIHTGAWSLLFSHPRTYLSTPPDFSLDFSKGLNRI